MLVTRNIFLLALLLWRAAGFHSMMRSLLRMSLSEQSAAHHEEQFKLFGAASMGSWKGIQTGYAVADSMVEDWVYTEVSVLKDSDSGELVHTNGFVAGEIRADCEVCYDSERLQSKIMGRYLSGKLPNIRCCANSVLRGPAPTRVGLSAELLLFHPDAQADMRIRVLLAYKFLADADINGLGKVPSALALSDVLIVRERREQRPLKLDENPDALWRPVDQPASSSSSSDFEFEIVAAKSRPVFAQRATFRLADSVLIEEGGFPQSPLRLPAPPSEPGGDADIQTADVYSRAFPGEISIEAGEIVYAGLESRVRVTWSPHREEGAVYCAEVAFSALETVEVQDVGLRVSPPRLSSFVVSST